MNIKIDKQVNNLKEIIKNHSVTVDGECVELHPDALEFIAQDYIYQEGLNNTKQEEIKKDKAIYFKNKNDFENNLIGLYGKFYFSFYKLLPDIGKQYLFRFIYLCTYLKYNDNKLMINKNNKYIPLYEQDLQDILKLSTREYQYTKKALIDNKLIYIDKEKIVCINNNIAIRGNIGNTKKDYIRIFNNSIQDIYNKSLPKEHKRLYLFIELLPYVNYNLNVLCFNPEETTPELIKPLTLEDMTKILNMYKGNNKYKLQKLLLNTFVNNTKVMMINKDYKKEFYIINPCIYYKGNKIENINYLNNLFRV